MRIAYAALAVFLIGCDIPVSDKSTETSGTETTTTAAAETTTTAQTATTPVEKPMSEYTDKVVELNTTKGKITIRFFPDVAPEHVRNFIDLAEQGFYNGIKFHRVLPGFVIQAGDPNTKTDNRSAWGTGGSGRNLKAEFNKVRHRRGILSMARSGHPDSASSQFFIVVAEAPHLNNQYTVFGEVVEGMDAVDKIVASAGGREMPQNPETIQTATVRAATPAEKGPTPQ